jgi:hypothetical protein
MLQVKV